MLATLIERACCPRLIHPSRPEHCGLRRELLAVKRPPAPFDLNTEFEEHEYPALALICHMSLQDHCAELFATVNGFPTTSLPACVNPDGFVYILLGVDSALEGAAPQLVLLRVLVFSVAP